MIRLSKSFFLAVPAILALVTGVGACGYSLVGRGSSLPPNIRSVQIPQFKNMTREPDLETIITRIVREEFIRDGRLKVIDTDAADSRLEGVILSYNFRPLTYDANNNVTDYSIEMVFMISHTENVTDRKLLKQRVETKWQYKVDPSITVAEAQRLAAIEFAGSRASESILSLVLEAF